MPVSSGFVRELHELAADVCWRQWSTLGAPIVPSHTSSVCSIVDAEALLLLTAFASQHERRLVDVLVNFAPRGAPHLSAKRLTSLAVRFPQQSRLGLGVFAQAALAAGDRRWKAFGEVGPLSARPRCEDDKWNWPRAMRQRASLMIRLRAGFGHGTKADALTFLLGRGGSPATTSEIADATQTSTAAVRTALSDMVMASFVREVGARPSRYFVQESQWRALLGVTDDTHSSPSWRNWAELFSYIANLGEQMRQTQGSSDYLAASAARDVYETHRDALVLEKVPLPDPDLHPGPRYLKALEGEVSSIRRWFVLRL